MARSAVVHGSAQNETVSERVVSAVAEMTGSDPLSLTPLYRTVDPDALEALFETDDSGRSPDSVTFTYCGCEVVVSGDGTVQVSESSSESWRERP